MTVEELEKQLEEERARAKALENSKSRLEEESKKYKERAKTAEEKLTEGEKAKLQEQGKLEELLAQERKEKETLKSDLISTREATLREKLRAEASKYGKDAHDVDMLLKVTDHKDLLTIDAENLTVGGVKEFVEKTRETHSYLFKKSDLDMGDGKKPDGKKQTTEEEYLAELDACTDRKQLESIKKKYGKN